MHRCSVLRGGAAWCSVAACCSVLHRDEVHNVITMSCDDACGVLHCVALCCAVLHCVALCCTVLNCVAVCCSAS